MTEKGCDNCFYTYFDERAYPCSLCIRGVERTDMWQPSKKTKADSKTEPSGYKMKPVEQTEPQRNMAEDIVESFGFKAESYRQAKAKTEPQNDAIEVAKDINRRVEMGKKEWEIRHTDTHDLRTETHECVKAQTEDKLHDYCKKRNCVWWSRSLRICLAERNGLACKCKSGKE